MEFRNNFSTQHPLQQVREVRAITLYWREHTSTALWHIYIDSFMTTWRKYIYHKVDYIDICLYVMELIQLI